MPPLPTFRFSRTTQLAISGAAAVAIAGILLITATSGNAASTNKLQPASVADQAAPSTTTALTTSSTSTTAGAKVATTVAKAASKSQSALSTAAPKAVAKSPYLGITHPLGQAPKGLINRTYGREETAKSADYFGPGDYYFEIVSDNKGTMLWYSKLVSLPAASAADWRWDAKVEAVFEIPAFSNSDFACWGWCEKDGKAQSGVLAVFDQFNTTKVAWKTDTKKLTLTPIAIDGIGLPVYDEEPSLPSRPEIYDIVATTHNKADADYYRDYAGVTVAGASTRGDDFISVLTDSVEMKHVLVFVSNDKVTDVVTADIQGDSGFLIGGKEVFTTADGQDRWTAGYVTNSTGDGKILKGWTIDTAAKKFVEVKAGDLKRS